MALLVVRFSQNVIKNYSIWLKTERETIISNYSDSTKIAPTVPLCTERLLQRLVNITTQHTT